MLDPDGYLLSWNAGAELITGYAAEERQGWHCSAFYPATPSSAVHLRMNWRSRRRTAGPRWRGCACARMVRSTSRASSRRAARRARQAPGFSRVLRDITEQRRMQDERERLRLEAKAERERARIGMDPHDGIIQSIHAVGLNPEAAADDVRADPAEAQRRIDQAIEKLNDNDPRHPELHLRVAADALHRRPRGVVDEPRAGVQGELADRHVGRDRAGTLSMDEDRGIAIFHVALEALANARKHSRATSVRLVLASDGGAVRVEVRDNGVGFDTGARHPEDHHGLRNMPVRVRAAGGAFSIESAPGAGTTVRRDAGRSGPERRLRAGLVARRDVDEDHTARSRRWRVRAARPRPGFSPHRRWPARCRVRRPCRR